MGPRMYLLRSAQAQVELIDPRYPRTVDHGTSTPGVLGTKRYVRKASHSDTASVTFCCVVFEGVHRSWPDCGQSAYNGWPCLLILDFSFRARTDKRRGTGCCISGTPRLHLGCISATSRVYLGY